jgi:hypothetical protein
MMVGLERPYALNPEKGYIVSANHKITSDDYKYFMVSFALFFLTFLSFEKKILDREMFFFCIYVFVGKHLE